MRLLPAVLILMSLAGCGGGSNDFPPTPTPTPTATPIPTPVILVQEANDLVWDSVHEKIYLSIPSTAASYPNSIAVLDPATGTIVSSQFVGSEPAALAISDDAQFLYAGLNGAASVARFTLPDLTLDTSISLGADSMFGPYFALDLQVAPGAPRTVAVTKGCFYVSPSALGGIHIYDDATERTNSAPGVFQTYDSIQWGADATQLLAVDNESTGFDFFVLSVSANGVSLAQDLKTTFTNFRIAIHYDRGANLIYSDDGRAVVPATGHLVGSFASAVTTIMVPDSTLNRAWFISQTPQTTDIILESFDLTHFTPGTSIDFADPGGGAPIRLIRWGTGGLAFNTTDGKVYVLEGAFVPQ